MENKKRALRRHHYARLKKNRQHYWGYGKAGHREEEMPVAAQGVVVSSAKPCSCYICGNPRKYEKKRSLKERGVSDRRYALID